MAAGAVIVKGYRTVGLLKGLGFDFFETALAEMRAMHA
jgi:hypothetical protein